MSGTSTRRALVLCVLLAACASKPEPAPQEQGRAAMDTLRAAVGKVVTDPARAKEVTAAVDDMQAIFGEALRATQAHTARLRALDADYDATQADMREALQDYNVGRAQRQARLLAARDRIAAATTEEEWQQLAKARRAVLESIVRPR